MQFLDKYISQSIQDTKRPIDRRLNEVAAVIIAFDPKEKAEKYLYYVFLKFFSSQISIL